jgi:hypothetical protein
VVRKRGREEGGVGGERRRGEGEEGRKEEGRGRGGAGRGRVQN